MSVATMRVGGTALQVAGSQFAVAGCSYLALAVAARHLDAAGFAAVSAYYLLINAGRGVFAAVELETTRAVAHAVAVGADDRPARRAAGRHTGMLLAGTLVLLAASVPLLGPVVGSGTATIALLVLGAVALAASYLLRGPLAGHRSYGRYGATFWVEAAAVAGGAGLLLALDSRATTAWIAVFAAAPLVAALVMASLVLPRRTPRVVVSDPPSVAHEQPRVVRPDVPTVPERRLARDARVAVLWSAALLLAGQGLWNLAPVVLTARLTDAPAVAAGFTTAAVVLRAPVLFFPSLQALLLPRFTAAASSGDDTEVRRLTRLLGAALVVGGIVWIVLAVLAVPALAAFVFATTTAPPSWALALLALSTVLGAAAQIGQTRLVAVRRPASAALAWLAGLAVLLAVGLLAAPPLDAATWGQLAGAAVVLATLTTALRARRNR